MPTQTGTRVDASLLRKLAAPLGLSAPAYARALELAGCVPNASEWQRLLSRFLLSVGVALALSGVAAFFAYNWAALPHLAKFALIQAGIFAGIAVCAWRGLDSPWGRSALFAAAVLCGILLAVFGQTYQTGADPYGLFLAWLLLILPWALIGRQPALWMLVVVLANLALLLFWQQVLYPPDGLGELAAMLGPGFMVMHALQDFRLAQLVFALNVAAMLAWEVLRWRGVTWAGGRWFVRLLAGFALAGMTGTTLVVIVSGVHGPARLWGYGPPVWFALFVGACLWFYRMRRPDLFILAACLLATIIVVTALVGRSVPFDVDLALLLALLVIGQTAAATFWLRKVAADWSESQQ